MNFLILLKERLEPIIIVSKLDCYVIFAMNTNICILKMVIYWNIVLSTVTISTMEIVLNNEIILNSNRMMKLLNQLTVPSEIVLVDNAIITYTVVNRKLIDQVLKYHQM